MDVERWDMALSARGLAPKTRRKNLAALRGFFRYLVRHGFVKANPAAEHNQPKVDYHLPAVVPASTIARMILSCELSTEKGARDASLLSLLFATGLRPDDVASLERTDFIVEQDRMFIHVSSGKGRKERRLPLHRQAVGYWRIWDAMRTDTLMAAFVSFRAYGAGAFNSSLTSRSIGRIFNHYSGKVGKVLSPKVARSTCASYLAAAGVGPWELADWLGHSSPKQAEAYRRAFGYHFDLASTDANPLTVALERGA
jgi:site-specific recombinase XerD